MADFDFVNDVEMVEALMEEIDLIHDAATSSPSALARPVSELSPIFEAAEDSEDAVGPIRYNQFQRHGFQPQPVYPEGYPFSPAVIYQQYPNYYLAFARRRITILHALLADWSTDPVRLWESISLTMEALCLSAVGPALSQDLWDKFSAVRIWCLRYQALEEAASQGPEALVVPRPSRFRLGNPVNLIVAQSEFLCSVGDWFHELLNTVSFG